jgi:AbiTii
MPSFVEDILSDAQGQSVPVATLLRRVKVAVSKLDNKKVEEWVDKELKGYSPEDEVPEYRRSMGPLLRVASWEDGSPLSSQRTH